MKHPQNSELGNAAVFVIVAVIVVAVVSLIGWRLYRRHHPVEATTGGTSASSVLATAGSSNSDLSADLNDIAGAVAQGGQSLSASDTALNDSQSQVTVPTE